MGRGVSSVYSVLQCAVRAGRSGQPTIYYVTAGDVTVTSCWSPADPSSRHFASPLPPPYELYDDVIKSA